MRVFTHLTERLNAHGAVTLNRMGFGKDGKGVIISESRAQALSTLANGTVLIIDTKLAMSDSFRMLKAEAQCIVNGLTAGEGHGLSFGLAHGDLSVAEIGGALAQNGPIDRSLISERDAAERPTWMFGAPQAVAAGGTAVIMVGPDGEGGCGPIMRRNPRWTFPDGGVGWNWFVINDGQALTTGATARMRCKEWGVWVGA